jgi:hypothetical protein
LKRLADATAILGLEHGFTFDDIGNRKTATVNGRASPYTPTLLNQYAERTIPGSFEVLGTAHPEATVTVNREPTVRQGELFLATSGTIDVGSTELCVSGSRRCYRVQSAKSPLLDPAAAPEKAASGPWRGASRCGARADAPGYWKNRLAFSKKVLPTGSSAAGNGGR